MLSWIGSILGLVPAALGTIDGITKAISNERIAATNAKTEQERIAAQERAAALSAKRDLMIVEASRSNTNAYVRAVLAIGPATILLKFLVWDKVIGSFVGCSGRNTPASCQIFVTDPLDENMWAVVTAVVGFYFLYEGAVGVARIVKS